jgi:hypothetical protein
MADTWFRFYNDAVNDPKVQKLSGDMFKAWVNLLCLASKGGGAVVKADVQFLLRVTEKCARGIIEFMIEHNLFDDRGDVVTPHNWDGRQFKSDASNDRVKRYRDRKRNGECNVTPAVTVTPPEQNRADTEQKIGDGGDAPAPLVTERANRLADQIAVISGHDLKFLPPSWLGAPYRVQTWVANGWPDEIILTTCREMVANKRDGPPNSVNFFEKGIARAIARHSAPLPEVKVIEAQTIEVTRGNSGNILPEADKLIERMHKFNDPVRGGEGPTVVRMLPKG